MPLRISGRSVIDRSQGRSSQVSGLPKIRAHSPTVAWMSSSGGLGQPGAKVRVAGVVSQAVTAQLGEVAGRQVARAPSGDPGIQRHDDALESCRFGTVYQTFG